MIATARNVVRFKRFVFVFAVLLFGAAVVYYTHRLTAWLAYDDEGGYLYAAWRISLGELPYRDFLTPQLPVFLYPGAAILALTGRSVWAMRFAMTLLTIGAAIFCFDAVRRIWGGRTALLMLVLLLIHREMFWAARFFRPEAPMLFWGMLGLWAFVKGYRSSRRAWLISGGAALGLSMMAKLFGALFMAGVGLFLLAEGIRTRRWRAMWERILAVGVPFALVVGGMTIAFSAVAPGFLAAVLGHHLRQGSGTPLPQVIRKGLGLFYDVARAQPIYLSLAALGVYFAWRHTDPLGRLFVWQLPTALVFLFITRELQERHLTYLAPSLAALGGLALSEMYRRTAGAGATWRKALAAVAVIGVLGVALWPHWAFNAWVAKWEEHTTSDWASFLQKATLPTEYIMSDYPGLNFYAQRPTTPLAAGISRGAAKSGQILGQDLIREIETYNVRMVLLNVAQGAHQFALLQDYDTFKHYVQTHFHLLERRVYDYRLIEVYDRVDHWEGEQRNDLFGGQLALTGVRWETNAAEPGQDLHIVLRWQKRGAAPMPGDYSVGLRLMDEEGHVRGLGSKQLMDIDRETYWDERGLEQAIPIPTSKWPDGETTVDLFQLPVWAATPPGTYRVLLRLHRVGAWDGFPLLGADGEPLGYDLFLGYATVLPASHPPAVAELPMQTHVDLDFTDDLRLEGYTLPEGDVRPGDRLTASVFWSARRKPSRDYRLRLTLQGSDRTWAETVTFLAGKDYPTSAWREGEVLLGLHDLIIDPETPTGTYRLVLELLDGERIAATYVLGEVRVAGRERVYTAPSFETADDAHWGGAITLLGHDLTLGKDVSVPCIDLTLHWQAQERMETSYTVFVHLVDEQEHIWGQVDRTPLDGTYPTSAWLPGEIVSDRYVVAWRDDAPEGEYRIAVGWYDLESGRRLPLYVQGARVPDDRYIIGRVHLDR